MPINAFPASQHGIVADALIAGCSIDEGSCYRHIRCARQSRVIGADRSCTPTEGESRGQANVDSVQLCGGVSFATLLAFPDC